MNHMIFVNIIFLLIIYYLKCYQTVFFSYLNFRASLTVLFLNVFLIKIILKDPPIKYFSNKYFNSFLKLFLNFYQIFEFFSQKCFFLNSVNILHFYFLKIENDCVFYIKSKLFEIYLKEIRILKIFLAN